MDTEIKVEGWKLWTNGHFKTTSASLDEIDEELDYLDGEFSQSVVLEKGRSEVLVIGGLQNMVVVTISPVGGWGKWYRPINVNEQQPDRIVSVTKGTLDSEHYRRDIISLELAKKAVFTYLLKNTLSEELTWRSAMGEIVTSF